MELQSSKKPEDPSKMDVLEFLQRNRGAYFSSAQIGYKFNLGKNAARRRLEALATIGAVMRSKTRSLLYYFVPAPNGCMAQSRVQEFRPITSGYIKSMRNMYSIIEERRLK